LFPEASELTCVVQEGVKQGNCLRKQLFPEASELTCVVEEGVKQGNCRLKLLFPDASEITCVVDEGVSRENVCRSSCFLRLGSSPVLWRRK